MKKVDTYVGQRMPNLNPATPKYFPGYATERQFLFI